MHLSARTIQEFGEICQDEFGVSLSTDEAEAHATRVMELMWLLLVDAKPTPDDSTKKVV